MLCKVMAKLLTTFTATVKLSLKRGSWYVLGQEYMTVVCISVNCD